MITDKVIDWSRQIVTFLIGSLPDAPLVVPGTSGFAGGVSYGTRCCAQAILYVVINLFSTVHDPTAGGSSVGSIARLLSFSPIFVVMDSYWMGFFIGCFFSVLSAFFVAKVIITMWQQIKW